MMRSPYLKLLVLQWEFKSVSDSSAHFPGVVKEQGGLGLS